MQKSSGENSRNRYTPTPSSRYGGPPTPNSAHSRNSRTPDHRRDARGSSSERYSHQSTRKLVRDSRSAQGSSRGSRGYRSQPSPSSTEETAEETTETDSQNEQRPGNGADYSQFQQQSYMYPQYAYPMAGYQIQPQIMNMGSVAGPIAPPQFLMA